MTFLFILAYISHNGLFQPNFKLCWFSRHRCYFQWILVRRIVL